jgi:hypothetical protein
MQSLKIWHFAMTALVVMLLVSLSVKHMFGNEPKWLRVSAKGLQQKISVGLEQIYWQWQNEGRPAEILYQPEHAQHAVAIKIRGDGTPQFEVNSDACSEFLNWFVQDVSIEHFVQINTNGEAIAQTQQACRYIIANHSFAYHVHTAQLLID